MIRLKNEGQGRELPLTLYASATTATTAFTVEFAFKKRHGTRPEKVKPKRKLTSEAALAKPKSTARASEPCPIFSIAVLVFVIVQMSFSAKFPRSSYP